MTRVDLKKELKHLYGPSAKKVEMVDVPPMNFLMVDGQGDPNTTPAYQEAIEALYAVAYALKFAVKKGQGVDYAVMPAEGLWWTDDQAAFSLEDRDAWRWTMMIMQPEWVTAALVGTVCEEVARKKSPPALSRLRFAPYHEGLAVQIMHVGPYSAEPLTIARMHDFIAANGYEAAGKHHEIYLGDPRRTAPEKLKTVLRQPVRRI